ncbi:MAG TPA: hypothetical protein VFF69_03930 [Phycisphaerales bacterium]|nr:hypothetical protein [Phycisphaerales bacterium]
MFTLLAALAAPGFSQADGGPAAPDVYELHPASRRLIHAHLDNYMRTPDGTVWNLWGEHRYFEIFNDHVSKQPIRETRKNGILNLTRTVGHQWELRPSREATAWALTSTDYWSREIGGEPPLRWTLSQSPQHFIHINEVVRDKVTEDTGNRCTQVVAEYSDQLFKVQISAGRGMNLDQNTTPSRLAGGSLVWLPDRDIIRDGYLTGEFILWPDDSIQAPPGATGGKFRYIPMDELRMTPVELEDAIESGQAAIVTWDYQKHDGMWRWVRKEHQLQYREFRSDRDHPADVGAGATKEPAPAQEITHLLVLADGSYVEGRLLSEDATSVRFLVVVSGIAAERVYARSEIGRLVGKN